MLSREQKMERLVAMVRARKALGLASRRRRVPPQVHPVAIEREYGRALVAFISRVRPLFNALLEEMPSLLRSAAQDRGRMDAGEGKRARKLVEDAKGKIKGAISEDEIEEVATRFAQRTSTYQWTQLGKQVKASLGIDLLTQDPALRAVVEGFAAENVALVKSIPESLARDVEKATTGALQDGIRWEELSSTLQERFSINENRAELLARDQIGKLYGQLNASRQQNLGIKHFYWRTVADERVRKTHAQHNGERYSFNEPPEGLLPGEDYLCRCNAEPDFTDILESL